MRSHHIRRTFLLALLLVSVVGISIGPIGVAAQESPPPEMTIRGSPDLNLHVPDDTVTPGRTNQVTIQITNDGDLDRGVASYRSLVTTARNVRLEADADGTPLTVETGEIAIGTITDKQPREVTIAVSVPEGVKPGTYEIDTELTYSHTYQQSGSDTTDRTMKSYDDIDVEIEKDPRFEIVEARTDTPITETGTLRVSFMNVGGETARQVRPTIESTSSAITFGSVRADTGYVESIRPGETTEVVYQIRVFPDAKVRPYPLAGTVQYRDPDGIEGRDTALSEAVTPRPEQGFRVESVQSNLRVNRKGTLEATLVNEGPRPVRDPVAVINTTNPNIRFGNAAQALDPLEPGERENISYDVTVADTVSAGVQQFDFTVQYTNAEGDRYASETVEANAGIQSKQNRFAIEEMESELRSGEEGKLRLTVVNNVGERVRDPVARLGISNPNVHVTTPEHAMPDLEPGERTQLTYEVEVTDDVSESVQQFGLTVKYTDHDGDRIRSETIETNAPVHPERDRFAVEVVNGTLQAGGSTSLQLRVTNTGNQTLTDINGKAFFNDPLRSTDDEALIPELEPGETEEILIDVSASGSAMSKTYPASIDFQYELPDGDTELSKTYKVPVAVTAGEGGGFTLWIAVPVLGAFIVVVWQRDRLQSLLPEYGTE